MDRKKQLTKECSELWKYACAATYGNKCLLCGKTDQTTFHHYIPKSKSKRLQFDVSNGIPICNMREHYILHHGNNPEATRKICDDIIKIRGKKWYNDLMEKAKRPEHSINTISWLEEQKKILEHIILTKVNIVKKS